MKAKAAALGKPLVVNMSFGSYFGARDGTSNYEQGLNNLSGPGVILVGAAGNEANGPIRATGTIAQGGSVTVGFNVPGTVTGGRLEIWYPGTNAYGVSVAGPRLRADDHGESRRPRRVPNHALRRRRSSARPARSPTTTTGRSWSRSDRSPTARWCPAHGR